MTKTIRTGAMVRILLGRSQVSVCYPSKYNFVSCISCCGMDIGAFVLYDNARVVDIVPVSLASR